ncbi:AAA family ATPase [Pseudenhygromyxa sp. WMMC2535]|uniref:DNA polymerase III subunit n=1 Tax=Pseudenhygromyxa sp. WMMC2535 TaxID=2712867 RepID=UPI001552DFBD|nr:AAA family ATPase [Pseudenhygromyxa sp. WMMC2535]NVB40908.1 AAA family ATPase [Pseudenhygromyxa sp. WMMC2535]
MEPSSASFPAVVGHERVVEMLSRAIARGRLHHGLVLSGPRGVGKAALARGLGCALICTRAPARGCGECDDCRRVLGGRHTDVRVLVGEGKSQTITAAAAREAAIRCQHAPFEAQAHVVIIDPADRMHPAAAAALLKAIEEPREGVYWVLLATNLHDILDTILSRCMTVPLERLGAAQTRTVVEAALADAAEPPSGERLELAISLSEGSPGVALELLGDDSLEPTRALLATTLRAMELGPAAIFSGDRSPLWSSWKSAVLATPEPGERASEAGDEDEAEVVVVKGPKGRKKKSRKKSKKKRDKPKESAARQRAAAARLAELWMLHLRELLRGGEGLPQMPRLSDARREGGELVAQMQAVQRFQASLIRNPNVRLSFEQLLLELAPPA